MEDIIYNTEEDLLLKVKECIGEKITVYDKKDKFKKTGNKGNLGQIIEEGFFGIANNNKQEPDFKNLGIELKVTPFKWVNNNKNVSAKERLVLTDINFMKDIKIEFSNSHCYEKMNKILILFYEYNPDITKIQIDKYYLYKYELISEEDKAIISNDYNTILKKIENGQAENISESDTCYLGACTKGATAVSSMTIQPYSDEKAKRRAFTLKSSYMTQLLRTKIFYNYENRENFIKDVSLLNSYTIFELVENSLRPFIGLSLDQIDKKLDIDINTAQNYSSLYSYISAMLKVNLANPNNIDEFLKAGIMVKTVRIMKNHKPKESMSFPAFVIKELIKEDWESSTLRNLFANSKFLICVFDEIDDKKKEYKFRGSFFWTMDDNLLETTIKEAWEDTKKVFIEGVKFNLTQTKKRIIVNNNLIKSADKRVIHVRPHSTKSTYKIENYTYNEQFYNEFGDKLPNGNIMTKQCFWLNKRFIEHLVNEFLS